MADVPMPPWLRKIQQGYIFQKAVLPTAVGFGGALLLQGCLTGGIENIGRTCVMGALNAWILSLVTSWLQGHSPGSASFDASGKPIAATAQIKEMADNVVAIQAKAADPAIPQVTQADANKAAVKLNDATISVALNNQIVKEALANEAKPTEK